MVIPFSYGWVGSGSSIASPLDGADFIDVSWSRNGSAAQQFYLDDLTVLGNNDEDFIVNTNPTAVPEPDTLFLLSVAGLGIFSLRRRLMAAST